MHRRNGCFDHQVRSEVHMQCDLEKRFSTVASTLPKNGNEYFHFRAGLLDPIPSEMQTDRIVVEKSSHDYDGLIRRDRLVFYASKEAYGHLGLMLAAVLFCPAPCTVTLHLGHPSSQIRHLVIRRSCPDNDSPGYHTMPFLLNYSPEVARKHPWADEHVRPARLPGFFLTNLQECVVSDADWVNRDVVVGLGSDEGMARLLELLLNMSQTTSDTNEIQLEGEGGFRGVAPLSCEATLLLPGAFGWDDTLWPRAL